MTPGRERLKLVGEWCIALAASATLAPLLIGIGAAVSLTSPGGPLYASARLGRGGRIFRCWKFRTMRAGAALIVDADAKTVVRDDDPRLTWLGHTLRRGFDELPQLWNVLVGDMTLIGPRPDADWMLPRYTKCIRRRLRVRPGITGLAQVLDRQVRLNTAQGYALDVWYIDHHAFPLDAWIAAATVLYLLGFTDVGAARLAALRRAGVLAAGAFVPRSKSRGRPQVARRRRRRQAVAAAKRGR